MKLVFPKLYVILDAVLLSTSEISCAQTLIEYGVELFQYRNKRATSRKLFEVQRELELLSRPRGVRAVVNDRADVAAIVGAGGVHVGQEDFGVEETRRLVGAGCLIGVSTHNMEQLRAADRTSADYVAIGPIFATATKENPDPTVGLEFVSRARSTTRKPLVAIGGITLETAREVWEAGADCVAVGRDIVCASESGKRAAQFLNLAVKCATRSSS